MQNAGLALRKTRGCQQRHRNSESEYILLEHDIRLATFRDTLDVNALSPHSWQAVPHYYMTSRPYYNYPHTFGLLFGPGLYARYREDADTLRGQFEELLASNGNADAATLVARFGFDLRSPDFWEGSLDVVRADIDQFVGLVEGSFLIPEAAVKQASPSF